MLSGKPHLRVELHKSTLFSVKEKGVSYQQKQNPTIKHYLWESLCLEPICQRGVGGWGKRRASQGKGSLARGTQNRRRNLLKRDQINWFVDIELQHTFLQVMLFEIWTCLVSNCQWSNLIQHAETAKSKNISWEHLRLTVPRLQRNEYIHYIGLYITRFPKVLNWKGLFAVMGDKVLFCKHI